MTDLQIAQKSPNLAQLFKNLEFENASNFLYPTGGWLQLILNCMKELEELQNKNPECKFQIIEIKEKFGLLTIYHHIDYDKYKVPEFFSSEINAIIESYARLSIQTCINCGSTDNVYKNGKGYWLNYLCDVCNKIEAKKCQK